MGVVTKTMWIENEAVEGGIELVTIPDADRYGLAVYVNDYTEVDPATLHNGTLVIDLTTSFMWYVRGTTMFRIAVPPPAPTPIVWQ